MHCGAPVVAARAGAMPEVLGEAAILVQADKPEEYRAAINAVLSEPQVAARLRANGQHRAGQLTWDAAGERLHSLIAPLV